MFTQSVGLEVVLARMGYDFFCDGISEYFERCRGALIRSASGDQNSHVRK